MIDHASKKMWRVGGYVIFGLFFLSIASYLLFIVGVSF